MHNFKWQQRTKRFILPLVSLLTVVSIVFTSDRSYAEDPSAAIIRPFGNNIVVREDNKPKPTPWNRDKNGNLLGKLRGFKDTLEIPGDNKSKANLNFISENTVVVDHAGLIARTVPSNYNTEYRFPCGLARGSITIGWRKAGASGDRACNQGLKVGPGVGKQSYRPNLNYRDGLQASKKILLAQSFSDVIVVPPDSGSRLVQVMADENAIETITLQGDILVKSEKHPQGRSIPEGNQYSYPKDTITPINCQGIANSPEIQELLNNNNWSYPDISQRVADGIANQITEHRAGLCRASQSPVWTLDMPLFQIVGSTDGTVRKCSTEGRSNIPVVQTGTSLNVNFSVTAAFLGPNNQIINRTTLPITLTGSLAEERVQMTGLYAGASLVLNGAIRPNGEIIGTATLKGGICDGLSDSFRMTR
ncbi:hypothetical protein [Microcoleus anatoxicus]|uniref:hypothetical protein n=1 Tax=Microcoleus anatoxicus TaxID=2705319 RepID=UPI0030C94BB4